MANRKINGQYGIFYHFDPDSGPDRLDGPEMVVYLKSRRNSPVFAEEEDSGIVIPGRHLAAFCAELIKMARELGVTGGEATG